MKIICRHADNDMEAYRIAQGMEDAGATVFSISHNGMRQLEGALIPSSRFIVWGKYEAPLTPDAIDDAISGIIDE